MPIDKAIYSAPQGIDELAEQENQMNRCTLNLSVTLDIIN